MSLLFNPVHNLAVFTCVLWKNKLDELKCKNLVNLFCSLLTCLIKYLNENGK